jgi:hypothetical protein
VAAVTLRRKIRVGEPVGRELAYFADTEEGLRLVVEFFGRRRVSAA